MLSTDADILKAAEAWRQSGRGVALATVVETWGSAPRPAGSHLVVDQDGDFFGSVSGGCVEGAVIAEAMDVIADGKPRLLEFGVADETAWRVGLSCGGRISVYVQPIGAGDPLSAAAIDGLNEARQSREATLVTTDLVTGDVAVVRHADRDAALSAELRA